VEIGPRDLAEGHVTVVTRHLREKQTVVLAGVAAEVDGILERVGPELLAEASAKREARTSDVGTLAEAIEVANSGFARISMGALGADGEDRLAEHALTIRCLQRADGSLAQPDDAEAELTAVVGRSY
jgi:prolyl-tRNA synthetase